ncbi:pyridoxamine 5'-phosphate oxidase family protein [Ferrimicrobium sp.]|uniref:pyridoxamine 5'-phosphate oxidase family protein n=1 Tax=Ferrimicrobium sp. TaxID=2926050 RepID=UPI002627C6D6|nr:pyridoxamine 5'-phosphate oxidase family protein [Ferrimicrobium sp.]
MGKRRSLIAMTDDEREAFLREGRTLNLASIGPDGRPHLVAMWYCLIEGTIWCWTYAKSQKAVNLRRDPRVTGLVETGEHYEELRGVTVYARAVIDEDLDQIRRVGRHLFARYQSEESAVSEVTFLDSAPKRIAFALMVEEFVSWDHRKLHGRY